MERRWICCRKKSIMLVDFQCNFKISLRDRRGMEWRVRGSLPQSFKFRRNIKSTITDFLNGKWKLWRYKLKRICDLVTRHIFWIRITTLNFLGKKGIRKKNLNPKVWKPPKLWMTQTAFYLNTFYLNTFNQNVYTPENWNENFDLKKKQQYDVEKIKIAICNQKLHFINNDISSEIWYLQLRKL